MERAAFLIEDGGERIPCLLNPESVVLRRAGGIAPRATGAPVTGAGLTDAPLAFTGGGWTELRLDLLFDVSLVAAPSRPATVRELTEPLWRLAENRTRPREGAGPPRVRFVWGRSWNIPGVVAAVAERLEQFSMAGAPQRSWMRLMMLRISDAAPATADAPAAPLEPESWPLLPDVDEREVRLHDLVVGGQAAERVDLVAEQQWGRPWWWRRLAEFNGIDDPLRIEAGTVLRVPPDPGEATP